MQAVCCYFVAACAAQCRAPSAAPRTWYLQQALGRGRELALKLVAHVARPVQQVLGAAVVAQAGPHLVDLRRGGVCSRGVL